MNNIAIIPARGGSKGVPRKNLALAAGKPLLAWSIEAALGCSKIKRVFVSTEDDEIEDVAMKFGAEVVRRPKYLASDTASTLSVVRHTYNQLKNNINNHIDIIATLQPTSPLRTSEHLIDAISLFEKSPEASSLISVQRVPHQFTERSLMHLRDGRLFSHFSGSVLRRQDKPESWARNGAAIYLTRSTHLEFGIWSEGALAFPMDMISSIDIDDMDSLFIADAILRKIHSCTNYGD